jgi:DNA-binding response OmpR family regulator
MDSEMKMQPKSQIKRTSRGGFIAFVLQKIEPDAERPFYILTVHGVGYRFNKEA